MEKQTWQSLDCILIVYEYIYDMEQLDASHLCRNGQVSKIWSHSYILFYMISNLVITIRNGFNVMTKLDNLAMHYALLNMYNFHILWHLISGMQKIGRKNELLVLYVCL